MGEAVRGRPRGGGALYATKRGAPQAVPGRTRPAGGGPRRVETATARPGKAGARVQTYGGLEATAGNTAARVREAPAERGAASCRRSIPFGRSKTRECARRRTCRNRERMEEEQVWQPPILVSMTLASTRT